MSLKPASPFLNNVVYYVPTSTREEQQNGKNRGDKVSSYEHPHRGMKPLEKPTQLITILLVSCSPARMVSNLSPEKVRGYPSASLPGSVNHPGSSPFLMIPRE